MTDEDLLQVEKETLGVFKEEFLFARDRYGSIDTKAQGTVAIAGIFLAAIFAFTRSGTALYDRVAQLFVLTALFFLVVSVLLAVAALKVRKFTAPPQASAIRRVFDQRIKSPAAGRSPLLGAYNQQASEWLTTITSLYRASERKAIFLEIAQGVLVLAIALVAISAALGIVKSP